MRSPKVLLAIILAITAIGLVLLGLQWWITGGIVTALGLIFLYFWWRLQQILSISEALMKEDFELARKRMAAIKNPEKLNAYSQTYYYFFQGMIETRDNNLKLARQGFKRALELNRFRDPDEKATAHLMLAQIDLRSRNREGARRHLKEAKGMNPSAQVREQINMIVKQGRLRI